ncbi:alpha/beta hydrolase [Zavarzinia compransoris]|uniref:alpha/beta hydrolase n=1 Tax=Zavarzinia marina TaxID=2911065 RepID=UPI001F34CEA4|nr:alpha/beta fold hydrolase [Zavarzinia marina]MCF4166018.1 alpha/beta hydrolase [Zavarzinia marina]
MSRIDGPRLAPMQDRPARQLIVLIHGFGADGEDLIGLAPYWRRLLPDAYFVAPDGPEPCDMAGFGRQWFPLTDFSEEERLSGARAAAPVLDAFIDAELERLGLGDDNLALVGFSQGCMMALHVGLRRARPPAAVVGFSGALAGAGAVLEAEMTSRPPILLVHGDQDPIVPVAALHRAVEALTEAGLSLQSHVERGLGHGIGPEGLALGGEFLCRMLLDPEGALGA